jgi:hypothetical protein
MTLIVHRKGYNPIHTSRFFPQIKKIAKERGLKSIGVVWVDAKDPQKWECHKCGKKHSKAGLKFDDGHDDLLTNCPTTECDYPFLVIKT